jgi:hypothetical protein
MLGPIHFSRMIYLLPHGVRNIRHIPPEWAFAVPKYLGVRGYIGEVALSQED